MVTKFFDSIDFWDRNNGLILGDPVDGYYLVMRTNDGGKTWSRVKQQSLPPILAKEAAFAASGNTLITGDNGLAWITTGGFSASVYRSTDADVSWLRETVPLFKQTQTAGGYALPLNQNNELFVMGGDYKQRDGRYLNVARYNKKNGAENRDDLCRRLLCCHR